jgi:uncharacterized membrane protein
VGSWYNGDADSLGFLRDVDGTYTNLNPAGSLETYPTGINASGQIVGYYGDLLYYRSHGFLRDVDGSYTTLDVPFGSLGTSASGINNAGQIVGGYIDVHGIYHGFLATPQ